MQGVAAAVVALGIWPLRLVMCGLELLLSPSVLVELAGVSCGLLYVGLATSPEVHQVSWDVESVGIHLGIWRLRVDLPGDKANLRCCIS